MDFYKKKGYGKNCQQEAHFSGTFNIKTVEEEAPVDMFMKHSEGLSEEGGKDRLVC